MLAVEADREDIVEWMMTDFGDRLDINKQDTHTANTVLHWACINNNIKLVQYFFEKNPKLCLKQNYSGETPLHLSIKLHKNIDVLKIFES